MPEPPGFRARGSGEPGAVERIRPGPTQPIDYDAGAGAFRAARILPPAALEAWGGAVGRLDLPRGGVALDLGAGFGQFVGPLHDWFGCSVVALEPSAGMRDQAARGAATGAASWVAARGEALPLATASVRLAWLSTVLHQFEERRRVLEELARVLPPTGRVLVRGYFRDLSPSRLLRLFPGAGTAAAAFPAVAEVTAEFESTAFTFDRSLVVEEHRAAPLARWLEQCHAMRHIDSFLCRLTDEQFAAGLSALRSSAEADETFEVVSQLFLLVFVRS